MLNEIAIAMGWEIQVFMYPKNRANPGVIYEGGSSDPTPTR